MPIIKKKASKYETGVNPLYDMLNNMGGRRPIFLLLLLFFMFPACKNDRLTIRIAATTDVHGMIYPYDFISRSGTDHSLAHILTYAKEQREKEDTLFFLLDNGDFLQGQPGVYYYNYMDTLGEHLSARVMNYMGYDAGTVGNHDIEAGPPVYDQLRTEFRFPWLAANAVNSTSGEPYFEPYAILEAGRRKIAVLGLITPGIPQCTQQSASITGGSRRRRSTGDRHQGH